MGKRSEAEEKYTWRLEDMIPDDREWEKLFDEVSGEIEDYDSFRGRLHVSADCLLEGLKLDDRLSQKIERLYVYARMRSDEDTSAAKYQDMFSRARFPSVIPHRSLICLKFKIFKNTMA